MPIRLKTFGGLARQSLTAVCVLLAFMIAAQALTARTNSSRASQNDQNVCTTGEREGELIEAIKEKNSARAAELLAAGVSPNARAESNLDPWAYSGPTCATALMYAARAGDVKSVESLLAAKADANATDNRGRHIWSYAFGLHTLNKIEPTQFRDELSARLQITKTLIAAGAKLDAQDSYDANVDWHETALFHAAAVGVQTGDLHLLQTVIAAGATVKNNNVLAYAMRFALGDERDAPGAQQVIRTLLDSGADVNVRSKGPTALVMATHGWASEGTARLIKVFLDAGADINAPDTDTGETPLLVALKYRSPVYYSPDPKQRAAALLWVDTIRMLLAAGADPNKNSPLAFSFNATWLRNFPSESETVFKALMAAGADVNSRDGYGYTLLSYLSADAEFIDDSNRANNLRLLRNLIAAGADVNVQNQNGQTPLYLAAKAGGRAVEDTIRVLLAAGADANLANEDGETPLMALLVSYSNLRAPQENTALVRLLTEAKSNLNAKNRNGDTALTLALQVNATPETVRTLLAAGADVNLANKSGDHSLIVAVKMRREDEIIQALLGAGARVDSANTLGDTALMVAAKAYVRELPVSRDERFFKTLVTAGADVTLLNHEGESALTIMVTKSGAGELPSIRLLLAAARRKGARGYPRGADLLIAIRRAAGNSTTDVVRELIKAGADVNAADESGRPALLVAAGEAGNAEVVRALLAAGARVNAKDKEGDTALIAAVREYLPGGDEFIKNALHRNTDVVRALLDAGADPRRRGGGGQSAIQLARKSGNKTLVGMIAGAARR